MADTKVRVGVRVRPLLPGEVAARARSCVSHPSQRSVAIGSKAFTYDHTFEPRVGQRELYDRAVRDSVASVFQGYNVTILAYGQTGSGKTYTMGTSLGGDGSAGGSGASGGGAGGARSYRSRSSDSTLPEDAGIVPRFVADAFAHIERARAQKRREFTCRVSLLEIYNEDIIDLLVPTASVTSWGQGSKRTSLAIREDENGVSVAGLKEVEVADVDAVMDVLRIGATHRTTAATLMNDTSSRSHAVFTLMIDSRPYEDEEEEGSEEEQKDASADQDDDLEATGRVVSKLTFVDLAGSERLKRTGAKGDRMREGININVGLLALGNVINALSSAEMASKGKASRSHVPYRVSKLTRLLQDALGGNSRTLFLACVSPADSNLDETLNTLRYASRARNIKNTPIVNVDAHTEQLLSLRRAIRGLQAELAREHFGVAETSDDDDALFAQAHVKSYLRTVMSRVAERAGVSSSSFAIGMNSPGLTSPRRRSSSGLALSPTARASSPVVPALANKLARAASKADRGDGSGRAHSGDAGGASGDESGDRDFTDDDAERGDTAFDAVGTPASAAGGAGEADDSSPGDSATKAAATDDVEEEVKDLEVLEELIRMEHGEAAFDSKQRAGQEQLDDMAAAISGKEKLLLKLRSRMRHYHTMRQRYERLLDNVREVEAEKENLLMQLNVLGEKTEASAAAERQHATEAVQRARSKLVEVESELVRLRRQQSQQKSMMKFAEREARRVSQLERDLESLRAAKIKLQRKQKDDATRHRQWMADKNREIVALRKNERKRVRQISQLQLESRRQQLLIGRRNQVVANTTAKLQAAKKALYQALQRRQKQRQTAHVDVSRRQRPTSRSRAASANTGQIGEKTPTRRRQSATHTPGSAEERTLDADVAAADLAQAVADKKREVDKEVFARVRAIEAEHTLGLELNRRSELMRELASCVEARDNLARGDGPDDGDGEGETVADVERRMESLETRIALADSRIEENMAALQLADTDTADGDASKRRSTGGTPVQGDAPTNRLDRLLNDMSLEQARLLLRHVVSEQADVHARERIAVARRKEAEATAANAEMELRQAQSALATVSSNFARRQTELQTQYEAEVLALVHDQADAASEAMTLNSGTVGAAAVAAGDDGGSGKPTAAGDEGGAGGDAGDEDDDAGDDDNTLLARLDGPKGMALAVAVLRKANADLEEARETTAAELEASRKRVEELERSLQEAKEDVQSANMQLAVVQQSSEEDEATRAAAIKKLSDLWTELGIPEEERERASTAIQNAVSNTCTAHVRDAEKSRQAAVWSLDADSNMLRSIARVMGEDEAVEVELAQALPSGAAAEGAAEDGVVDGETAARRRGLLSRAGRVRALRTSMTQTLKERCSDRWALHKQATELLDVLGLNDSDVPSAVRDLLEVEERLERTKRRRTEIAALAIDVTGEDGVIDMQLTSPHRRLNVTEGLPPAAAREALREVARSRVRSAQKRRSPRSGSPSTPPASPRDTEEGTTSLDRLSPSLAQSISRALDDTEGADAGSGTPAAAAASGGSGAEPLSPGGDDTEFEWRGLPVGTLSKGTLLRWRTAVRELVILRAHRRFAVQAVCEQARVSALEMGMNGNDLYRACRAVGATAASDAIAELVTTLRKALARKSATQTESQPAGAGVAAAAAPHEPLPSDESDAELACADLRSVFRDVPQGEVIAEVVAGLPSCDADDELLRAACDGVVESGAVISVDSASVWHMLYVAVVVAAQRFVREVRMSRRSSLVHQCFGAVRDAVEAAMLAAQDEQDRSRSNSGGSTGATAPRTAAASSADPYDLSDLEAILEGEGDDGATPGTGDDAPPATLPSLPEDPSALTPAAAQLAKLARHVRSEEARFRSALGKVAVLSLRVYGVLDRALTRLYRLLDEAAEVVAYRLRLLWAELTTGDSEQNEFWHELGVAATTEAARWVRTTTRPVSADATVPAPSSCLRTTVHGVGGGVLSALFGPESGAAQRPRWASVLEAVAAASEPQAEAKAGIKSWSMAPDVVMSIEDEFREVPVLPPDVGAIARGGEVPSNVVRDRAGDVSKGLRSSIMCLDHVTREGMALAFVVVKRSLISRGITGAVQELLARRFRQRGIESAVAAVTRLELRMKDFEAKAGDKSRFQGSSLVFLEEERFRRGASALYPRLIRKIWRDVVAWEDSEQEPFILCGTPLRERLDELLRGKMELMHLSLLKLGLGGTSSTAASAAPAALKVDTQAAASAAADTVASPGPAGSSSTTSSRAARAARRRGAGAKADTVASSSRRFATRSSRRLVGGTAAAAGSAAAPSGAVPPRTPSKRAARLRSPARFDAGDGTRARSNSHNSVSESPAERANGRRRARALPRRSRSATPDDDGGGDDGNGSGDDGGEGRDGDWGEHAFDPSDLAQLRAAAEAVAGGAPVTPLRREGPAASGADAGGSSQRGAASAASSGSAGRDKSPGAAAVDVDVDEIVAVLEAEKD